MKLPRFAPGTFAPAIGVLLLCAAAFAASLWAEEQTPPADAKPLSAILQRLESSHAGVISGVEYKRNWWRRQGHWEVAVCRLACEKLQLDPRSGELVGRKPYSGPDGPLPTGGLAALLRTIEQHDPGTLVQAEFWQGAWEIRALRQGRKQKLRVQLAPEPRKPPARVPAPPAPPTFRI